MVYFRDGFSHREISVHTEHNRSTETRMRKRWNAGRFKTLAVAIEEDSSQTCSEHAKQFNTSSETVRLHLHRLSKTVQAEQVGSSHAVGSP
ncbi:hypothetical protein TNCV_2595981 [Trichonephila clavipes]|nr:hypothetical protein TNCV_2595981 [Trichonephila clavipes]